MNKIHQVKMDAELDTIFRELQRELIRINIVWNEFICLFGKEKSRVDLLNRSASSFFRIVQDALWEQTVLHIARITDAPKTAGKSNLTIRALPEFVDAKIQDKVKLAISDCLNKCSFCKEWRNKKIAHKDLNLLKDNAITISPISKQKVNSALNSIAEILNTIQLHYFNRSTLYHEAFSETGEAISLIYLLDSGHKMNEIKNEIRKSGDYNNPLLIPRNL